jgi:hypothetical protein
MRHLVLTLALPLLAACNSAAPPAAPATSAAAPNGVTPSSFRLPEGSGCSGAIGRFNAIIDNDLETGHVNAKVHTAMKGELEKASAACSAGKDAQAQAMVAAIRKRHGYPAG